MYSRKPTQGKEGNAMFSVACLFAVQFVSFLEGRGIGAVPFPFPGIIVGIFCGLLCGGLLFSTRLGKQYASLWLLSLTAVSVLLWGNVLRNNDALSCYGACMLGAAVLPPVLARLLAASRSPGLHVGIAFAIGDFFWLFLYLLPAPPSAKFLQGILLVLQSVGGGLAAFDLWKANRAVPPVPEPELTHQGYRRYESLGYLTAITLVFFILNAFIDIPFYRMHDAAFPIPAQVHLFIWIVYPLTGLFIDKRGADMRLLLVCLGGNILPPTLIAITEGTVLYWFIYTVVLASRSASLLYLLLVFARINRQFQYRKLVIIIPYLAMLAAFMGTSIFVEYFPGTLHIILWSLFLTAAFSYISSRIQYALTLSNILPSVFYNTQSAESDNPPFPRKDRREGLARFSAKYGISAREQDVLQLITKGYNTTAICASLHISENTTKTHVRQLLRKTETHNRIALTALFFSEMEKGEQQEG